MPNIKSAKKRVIISEKKRLVNKMHKSELHTAIRKFREAIAVNPNAENIDELFNETVSIIDKVASHGSITKNSANNKKSRLAMALNKARAEK